MKFNSGKEIFNTKFYLHEICTRSIKYTLNEEEKVIT